MCKISIVVPVYNVEKYISNFLKSVINQSFDDFELLLINDGSKDSSISVAEDILRPTSVKYRIINKENGGQSTARNVGIKEAIGEWIVIPDSDDVLQKDYLKLMFEQSKSDDVDVVFCNINNVVEENIFEESKRSNKLKKKSGKEFFEDFFMHRIMVGPVSLMIRKSFLYNNNILFNEKSRYSEEFTFICRVLYFARMVVHVEEKTYNYCLRKGSVSTGASADRIINGYNEIIKNSSDYFDNDSSQCRLYQKYAMPRWILGTARFTASNLDYHDYKQLMVKLNAKQEIKKLIRFPNLKTKMAAMLFCFSNRLFYTISRI